MANLDIFMLAIQNSHTSQEDMAEMLKKLKEQGEEVFKKAVNALKGVHGENFCSEVLAQV